MVSSATGTAILFHFYRSFEMKLRYLGFCGVDDSVALPQILDLSHRCPHIEWGFLLRSDKEGTPRYASQSFLRSLRGSSHALHLAAHLCADYCTRVLEGDYRDVSELIEMGFKRFQLNPTLANGVEVDSSRHSEYVHNVRNLMVQFSSVEFLLQANEETAFLYTTLVNSHPPENMSILFDASCGTGVTISSIHQPFKDIPCGYAGGISPSNLMTILESIELKIGDLQTWVDMESSLRVRKDGTNDDVFNINACEKCVSLVEGSRFLFT